MAKTTARQKKNLYFGAPDIKVKGGIAVGPAVPDDNTHWPTDASTEWKEELKLEPLGYVANEGITLKENGESKDIEDWDESAIATAESKQGAEITVTYYEAANAELLKMLYGDANVKVEGTKIEVTKTTDQRPNRALGLQMKSNGKPLRYFFPDTKVTTVGDIKHVKSDLIKYQVTHKVFPNSDGVIYKRFSDTADSAAASEDDS